MIFFNEPWLTIRWDDYCQAVHMEWKSYVEGEDAYLGLNTGLELFRRQYASRWLADVRRLGPIRQIDQQWINHDWYPRVVAAGLRYMATIVPKSAVARLSMKQLHGKISEQQFLIHDFDDLEQGREWLRQAK